ncbi:hypothetical protein APR12_005535 [Nocardia amikacinitolerans]|nr:hypothetical protein [Nocardia amikacinitolerans]
MRHGYGGGGECVMAASIQSLCRLTSGRAAASVARRTADHLHDLERERDLQSAPLERLG